MPNPVAMQLRPVGKQLSQGGLNKPSLPSTFVAWEAWDTEHRLDAQRLVTGSGGGSQNLVRVLTDVLSLLDLRERCPEPTSAFPPSLVFSPYLQGVLLPAVSI